MISKQSMSKVTLTNPVPMLSREVVVACTSDVKLSDEPPCPNTQQAALVHILLLS